MTYVWYSKATSTTGKAIAESLGLTRESARDVRRGYGVLAPPKRATHVISWGAVPKTVPESRLAGKVVLNNPFNIRQYTNKFLALQVMAEHGVPIPKVSRNALELDFPVVRRPDRHWGGLGFQIYETEGDLSVNSVSANHHYLEFIENTRKAREYRIHVFNGEIIKVSRKKKLFDDADTKCKSHENGWYFSLCDLERVTPLLKEVAINAVNALGYDFGAVDMIYRPDRGDMYVFEVNSGMGLDNSGLDLYVSKINGWLGNDT